MKASTLSSCPGVGWLQQWHCCYCGAQTGIRWPRGCGGPWVVALGMGQRAGGMGHGRELGRRCHRAVGQPLEGAWCLPALGGASGGCGAAPVCGMLRPRAAPYKQRPVAGCGSRLLGSGPINLRSLAVVGDKGCPCSPRPRHGF